MTGNERSLYPCLSRARQACTCAVNKYLHIKSKYTTQNLSTYFSLSDSISLQNNQSVSNPFYSEFA